MFQVFYIHILNTCYKSSRKTDVSSPYSSEEKTQRLSNFSTAMWLVTQPGFKTKPLDLYSFPQFLHSFMCSLPYILKLGIQIRKSQSFISNYIECLLIWLRGRYYC